MIGYHRLLMHVKDKIPQDPRKAASGGGLRQLTIEETGLGPRRSSGHHRSSGLNKPQTIVSGLNNPIVTKTTVSAHHTECSPGAHTANGRNNPKMAETTLSAHHTECSPSAHLADGLNNPKIAKTTVSAHHTERSLSAHRSTLDKPQTFQRAMGTPHTERSPVTWPRQASDRATSSGHHPY